MRGFRRRGCTQLHVTGGADRDRLDFLRRPVQPARCCYLSADSVARTPSSLEETISSRPSPLMISSASC